LALLFASLLSSALPVLAQDTKTVQEKPDKRASAGPSVEIRLHDDSNLKVLLRDEIVELHTPYGKLVIPAADITMIEFTLRVPEEVQKQITTAIADLAHVDFKRREAASSTLVSLRERAYPALVQATKSTDLEVSRRAEQALEKLRETVPEESLTFPATDIVHTGDSKIAGQIKVTSFRVGTLPFGDQQLKLADVRTMKSQTAAVGADAPAAAKNVIQDPGTLTGFRGQVGQVLAIRVTAPPAGLAAQGGVYGTNIYTLDSSLAIAAVHAGALKPGQTAVVRVTVLGPQVGFQASVQNGIISNAYGPWDGFRIEVPRNGGAKKAN